MESVFMDKAKMPTENDLKEKLRTGFSTWNELKAYLHDTLIQPGEEWNYPGKKYGWSFRMKSKKRNIIYFLPREGYFNVAFVFGQKAFQKILESNVKDYIKKELSEAKVYAEGRGIRIDIRDSKVLDDIYLLIDFKLEK